MPWILKEHETIKNNEERENVMKNKTKIISMALCLGLATTGAVGMFTGCSSSSTSRSTGQYIDDKTTAQSVRHALGSNTQYKFDQVSVSVYRGDCQLSGFVPTEAQKAQAADIAKGVQGVSSVENNITVRSP